VFRLKFLACAWTPFMVPWGGAADLWALAGQEVVRQALYFLQNQLSARRAECPAAKVGCDCPSVDCQRIVQPLLILAVITFAVAAVLLFVIGFLIGCWYGSSRKDAQHPRRRGGGILVHGSTG